MTKIRKEQYEFALQRIEELMPLVDDNTPVNDRNVVELTLMSDIVIDYEEEHFPMESQTKKRTTTARKTTHRRASVAM